MKKIFSYLCLLVAIFALAACKGPGVDTPPGGDPETPKELVYADGTVLNMAVAHNSADTTITFSEKIAGSGLTLADGKTYQTGDLKPVWAELEKILKIEFNNVYTGADSAQNEFKAWQTKDYTDTEVGSVDVLVGNADQMTEDGKKGKIVDLSKWLDYMPNFKEFLDSNPIVKLSVISDTQKGSIYYAPYFDGFDDIEKYFLMRVDWIQKLLDGEGDYVAEKSDTVGAIIGEVEYQPYMPTEGSVAIESLNAAGNGVQTITKNYETTYGNIVDYMNKNVTATTTGVELVNMVRDYIDAAYGGYYGTTRSNLFAGNDAAWDADELVALLRCVVTNTYGLTGQNDIKVTGIFPREAKLQRISDLFNLVSLFGVRGYESRNDYLYFDAEGNLVDARGQEDYVAAMDRLADLYKEGLILQDFDSKFQQTRTDWFKYMYQENLGFMLYDYVQTQCLYNDDKTTTTKCPEFNLTAVMTPVAKWYDGSNENGTYMRFTESWRSVKTNGWCIPTTATGDKLQAALKLFDYMYSDEGNILMSFGPNAWRSGETIDYKGEQQPEMSEAALAELWNLGKGNYTNYARQYLGSTLPVGFVKNQAMEYQCTTEKGKAGAARVSNGIALGTVKHVSPYMQENLWYTMVPTTLPTTSGQDTILGNYAAIADGGLYSKSNNKYSIYVEIIKLGLGSGAKLNNTFIATMPASAAELVAAHKQLGGTAYMDIKAEAWQMLLDYYNEQNK